jgi:acyl carrier protein
MTHNHNAILEVLARHVEKNPAELHASDTLTDVGIDSLKFIMLVLEFEQLLGRKVFDVNNVGKLRTVGDIMALADGMPAQQAVRH